MLIICASKHSNLANKLILAARFFVWGKRHSIKVCNPSFTPHAKYYANWASQSGTRKIILELILRVHRNAPIYLAQFFHHLATLLAKSGLNNRFFAAVDIGWQTTCNLEDPHFEELANTTFFLFLTGWNFIQEIDYEKYRNEIEKRFEPIPNHTERAKALIKKAKGEDPCRIIIGLHVRQGDYKSFQDGKYYFNTEQYVRAIRTILAGFKDQTTCVVVCSNEKQSPEDFSGFDCIISEEEAGCDLVTLSLCDYILGPPSTFSHWASFIGKVPRAELTDPFEPPRIDSFVVATL